MVRAHLDALGVSVREVARVASVDRASLIGFLDNKRALSSRTLARVFAAIGLGFAPLSVAEALAMRKAVGVDQAQAGVEPNGPGRPSRQGEGA